MIYGGRDWLERGLYRPYRGTVASYRLTLHAFMGHRRTEQFFQPTLCYRSHLLYVLCLQFFETRL